MKRRILLLAVLVVAGELLWGAPSTLAATVSWNARGVKKDSQLGSNPDDLSNAANWAGGLPTTNDTAVIDFDNGGKAGNISSDANLTNKTTDAFTVSSLSISNETGRIGSIPHTDTVTFSGTVTLASNLLVTATGGANGYALGVVFNNAVSIRNVTFDGAKQGTTAGITTTAALTFGGATAVTSNFNFNGSTGFSVLNLNGSTTVGHDLTFTGGAGTNLLNIAGTTTVSNNVSVLNSAGSISNLFVLTGELRVGGNFSNTTATANKAGFQAQNGTVTLIGGGVITQLFEVASVGTAGVNNYLIRTFQAGNNAGAVSAVRLVDGFVNNTGGSEQLLANNLRVFPGSTLDVNGLSAAFQNGTNAGTIAGITTAGKGLEVLTQLDNAGTIQLGGGSILGTGGITNSGTITGFGAIASRLVNSGTLSVTGGTLALSKAPIQTGGRITVANAATLSVAESWANGGTLSLSDGTVVSSGGLTNLFGGRIEGNGTLTGNVVNQGTISPGFSPGSLTFNGNLTLGNSSVAVIELASLSLYDRITVNGALALGGTLNVVMLGGYAPNPGDTFDIFSTTGGPLGNFSSVTGGYGVNFVGTDIVLTVIPEPSSVTLVASGLLFLALVQRRRSR